MYQKNKCIVGARGSGGGAPGAAKSAVGTNTAPSLWCTPPTGVPHVAHLLRSKCRDERYDAVAPVTMTSAVRKPASSANAAPCIERHVLQWQYAGACDGVTDFTSIITPPHAHRPLSSGTSRDDSGRIRSQRRLIKWLCAFAYAAVGRCKLPRSAGRTIARLLSLLF